jgi:hypothetical protein
MRRLPILVFIVFGILAATMALRVMGQNQPGGSGQNGGDQGGGPGGGGGPPRAGFHLLPPFVVDQLNLTDDQKQQVAQLEKDTKAKLATILTADQLTTLDNARPPRHGGQGGGGQGGGGPGGDGAGPGGDQGPPN